MKAVILNSGMGSRMGALTSARPKCLVPLDDAGTTILDRQLQRIMDSGIRDVVITTGHVADVLESHLTSWRTHSPLNIRTVWNPRFASTNYIESLRLAKAQTQGSVILMHGDLVFASRVWNALLDAPLNVLVTTPSVPIPEKDFKARLGDGGRICEVSIHAFGPDCVACQPLYKLDAPVWARWMEEMEVFCAAGNDQVYAENALNKLTGELDIRALPVAEFCMEVDNETDWALAKEQIRKENE